MPVLHQMANMLESPLAMSLERGKVPYVAFDMHPARLKPAREAGFNVFYGDASRPAVSPRSVPSHCLAAGQATCWTRDICPACPLMMRAVLHPCPAHVMCGCEQDCRH